MKIDFWKMFQGVTISPVSELKFSIFAPNQSALDDAMDEINKTLNKQV